mgnify:CR=1 FL=1
MYHLQTSNRSFINVSNEFKELGITNHDFMLYLQDKDLAYVDPFAVHPKDYDMQQKVIVEAVNNPWYFTRECIRIFQSGGDSTSFELNNDRATVLWSLYRGHNTVSVHPRQSCAHMIAVVVALHKLLSGQATPIFRDHGSFTSDCTRQQLINTATRLPDYMQQHIYSDHVKYSYGDVSRKGKTVSKPISVVNRSFVTISDAIFQNDLTTTLDTLNTYQSKILPTVQRYVHTTGRVFENQSDYKRQVDALLSNCVRFEPSFFDKPPALTDENTALRIDMFTSAEFPIDDYVKRNSLSTTEALTEMYGQFLIA